MTEHNLKRWYFVGGGKPEERDNGEWVGFSDVEPILAENKALREANEAFIQSKRLNSYVCPLCAEAINGGYYNSAKKALADVAALEGKVKELDSQQAQATGKWADAEARCARYVDAFRKYGSHKYGCYADGRSYGKCECGFEAALRGTEGEE